jgi:hypothetical protein
MAIQSMTTKILDISKKEITMYKLMDNASTDETLSDEIEVLDADAITAVIEASSGVSAGVVIIEGSNVSGYAGTWLPLVSLTINAASKLFEGSISLANGDPLVRYVRLRIETAISGGTIDAYLNVRK